MNTAFWRGKRVLLTGHTGFKGSWLSLWLNQLGAKVHGYSLEPPTTPSFYEQADIAEVMASDSRADINDYNRLKQEFDTVEPEIVFHLAAQSLVRESYNDPLLTIQSNVLGTANVLEASRHTKTVKAIVLVTSDKVYKNIQSSHAYHEQDRLGGVDPYSASKAACEIISDSYRQSFFTGNNSHVANIATVRSGNVIGGGDWAEDRLVPDCFRAVARGEPVKLRYPHAVRPWQHVLEPLAGYIVLAEKLYASNGAEYARAWNFGPDADSDETVSAIVTRLLKILGDSVTSEVMSEPEAAHETQMLKLDSSDAKKALGWRTCWGIDDVLQHTAGWQKAWLSGENIRLFSLEQIRLYELVASS